MRAFTRREAPTDRVVELAQAALVAQQERALAAGHVHIGVGGTVVIDLTVTRDRPTTDITCRNCGGRLLVGEVSFAERFADMACVRCNFRYREPLQLDDTDPGTTPPVRRRRARHLFA